MKLTASRLAGMVLGASTLLVLILMQMSAQPPASPPASPPAMQTLPDRRDTAPAVENPTPGPAPAQEPEARALSAPGIVEPDGGEIELGPQIYGLVAAVHVREGDSVTRGSIVAELVNDDRKARLAQSQANLEIERADLERLQNGPRPQEIRQSESLLAQEEENLKLLARQLKRRQALLRKGAVSREEVDYALTLFTNGRQRRDAAEQSLLLLKEGTRLEEIAASRARVQRAERQVDEARAVLEQSYIRASTDGTVLRLYKTPGEAVSTQPIVPVALIGDTSKLVVRAHVDETDIAELRIGQQAKISAAAFGNRQITGKIVRISPRLDAKTIPTGASTENRDARVLDVFIALDTGVKLPIGLRVDVLIDVASKPAEPGTHPLISTEEWTFRL